VTAPDYSGTAVITFHEAGYGEGMWRASCPVDCGWHGSDHVKREEAVNERDEEAQGHWCLRAPVSESRPSLRATGREREQADG
jgi:hypothetical protein